jgi:PadR family transcriptional regulator PadR
MHYTGVGGSIVFMPTELLKGNTALMILACVAKEPMHGYRISKEIDTMSRGYFAMREGTLYAYLHEMERDGLIEGYWQKSPDGPKRKLYRITDLGTTELTRRTQNWKEFQISVNSVLGVSSEAT